MAVLTCSGLKSSRFRNRRQRLLVVKERSSPRRARGEAEARGAIIPLPHGACFSEMDDDGIGRRAQRRVIRESRWYPTLSSATAADKGGAPGKARF